LNVREWTGRNPIRMVVDRNNRLPKNLHLFDGSQETIIVPTAPPAPRGGATPPQPSPMGRAFLAPPLGASLIVEGGAKLLQSFIDAQLFDEIRVFRSPNELKKGILAPVLPKNITIIKKQNLLGDELTIYKNLVFS
jgi:diaminohydroxyphosphoribosylaminopyrimidine deaminase/5-amino-6-(5-phosphoribosylamino)uracil reductase